MGLVLAPGGLSLYQDTGISGGNNINSGLTLNRVSNGLSISNPGLISVNSGNDNARTTLNTRGGAIEVRQNVVSAVPQTDPIDIAGITAPIPLVLSLGQVMQWLDIGTVNLALGDVLMIDPNGVAHDLFSLAIDKTTGDGFIAGLPVLPPGIYSFYNTSGGALTVDGCFVRHTGARNLT